MNDRTFWQVLKIIQQLSINQGNLEGGSFTGHLKWQTHEGGLWKRSVSLSLSLYGSSGRRSRCVFHFLGTLKDRKRKVLETGISIGAPLGYLEEGFVCQDFWEERLCLCELCEGGWRGGGLLYKELWKLRKNCRGRLWNWIISLLMEAPSGAPEWRAPILRIPRDMWETALETENFFNKSPWEESKALGEGKLGQYVVWAKTCTWYILLFGIT